MDKTATSTKVSESTQHARAFEDAREAVFTLRDSRSSLSPQEKETLSILMDKELMGQLNTSLRDARDGKVEPLENILD
ncbi:hypothetical protein CL632_01430 [bacterium]|mgnify:CR=1 FL=1|jgi:hypothetical protein|nr:hypothetical protein [bacterium]MDP6571629.1 hypothetical protein [Patescibacteria group bacterium]MDP6756593.1 hypothetical protein [Patescibacteria group bacterium]|tara:strand:- start:2563 stop:2796 length:234 start_codon:yes stop_codon:yes gene_type:complete